MNDPVFMTIWVAGGFTVILILLYGLNERINELEEKNENPKS